LSLSVHSFEVFSALLFQSAAAQGSDLERWGGSSVNFLGSLIDRWAEETRGEIDRRSELSIISEAFHGTSHSLFVDFRTPTFALFQGRKEFS
jgi:hypothetical protein